MKTTTLHYPWLWLALTLAAALATSACGHRDGTAPAADTTAWDYVAPPPLENKNPVNVNDFRGAVYRIPVEKKGKNLEEVFNDSNVLQLIAAKRNGFTPITDLQSAYAIGRPMVRIYSCDAYLLDSLTHSMPYLVPKAAQLLKEIGYAFSDSVRARGGKRYRMKVTSLTRSDFSVGKLVKYNRNATVNSCHRYGTTFDISWVSFDCLDPSMVLNVEDLKYLLAEVVYDFRSHGRCYAVFEPRGYCIHITVR